MDVLWGVVSGDLGFKSQRNPIFFFLLFLADFVLFCFSLALFATLSLDQRVADALIYLYFPVV